MKVSLIDFTGAGTADPSKHAAAVLIFTKSTRLEMNPGLFNEIYTNWPMDKMLKELEYMANTIPSSWEFCHYTFMIEGVTRAFTHQLVRTRTASFAQQTMRVLNVNGWTYGTGPSIQKNDVQRTFYDVMMGKISEAYAALIRGGAEIEDARGVLPTNIHTNIVMGVNLRTLVEMIHKRSSPRTQSEYRDVLESIKAAMVAVHPWTKLFIDRTFDRAAKELDEYIEALKDEPIDQSAVLKMKKLVDQLRQKQ